eukprot:TRINITY_DN4694_c0_g1_i1.p1 TRINITY_DN4694_c0_g1~~TRINITY_DN4694_c0_g1_i1.p1  ORF type:complete len:396 (+),score=94.17 TRINITY_DN4694_c0_g1_i1:385-1572(+)
MSAPSKKDKKLSKEKSKDKSRKEAAPQTEASRRLAEFKVARNKKYEREDGTTPTMGAGQDLLSTLQIWPEDDLEFSLGDFEMTSVLGTGTFGRVLLARHRKTGKYYAIKVLKKTDVVRLKQVDHILNEKNILMAVRNPFVVNLYRTFQDDENLYMLMEYVIGGELFSHLRRVGNFDRETTIFYAAEIVMALEYMHGHDVIYRDLKPENILIGRDGHVKITDFGFAKRCPDKTWTLCGTPEYLAPEIITSRGHGKGADYWALGVLIYEMLAGYPPYYDDNPFGIYEKILAGTVHFPEDFDPVAKDLIKQLLTADLTKRIGNLRHGASDVKNHPFFASVDWKNIYRKRHRPPFVPRVAGEGDTSNFEVYPEDEEDEFQRRQEIPPGKDPYKELFLSF